MIFQNCNILLHLKTTNWNINIKGFLYLLNLPASLFILCSEERLPDLLGSTWLPDLTFESPGSVAIQIALQLILFHTLTFILSLSYSLSLFKISVHRGDSFHLPGLRQLVDLHQDEAELIIFCSEQVWLQYLVHKTLLK